MMKKTPMRVLIDQNRSDDWTQGFGMALQLVHRRPEVVVPFAALFSSYFVELGFQTLDIEAMMDSLLADMQDAIP
jgi:hypothetical protein